MSDSFQMLLQYGYLLLFAFIPGGASCSADPCDTCPAGSRRARSGRTNELSARYCCRALRVACCRYHLVRARAAPWRSGSRSSLSNLAGTGLVCATNRRPVHEARPFRITDREVLSGAEYRRPPLARITGVGRRQFVLLDSGAALLWAACWAGLGYLFRHTLELVARKAAHLGNLVVVIFVAALVAYVAYKFLQRQHFLRMLRMARITAEELKAVSMQATQILSS